MVEWSYSVTPAHQSPSSSEMALAICGLRKFFRRVHPCPLDTFLVVVLFPQGHNRFTKLTLNIRTEKLEKTV